jgi:Relaxase/Mobilisation nuclease domain
MIGRNYPPAKSFVRQSRYLLQDQTRAETLYQEGVRGHDYRLMAQDFEMIYQLHPGRTHPVFHSVLDFHPNERLDDARMIEIAQKYLAAIRMINTQYAIIKHLDTSHTHMHIIANRIDYNGNYIQTYPEILNSNDAVRQLVREYDLIPAGSKNLRQTNFDALDNSETRKYAIYRGIKECLPGCRGLEELEQKLLLLGIDTQYRMDKETGQRLGISFRYQNEAFKGSNIDRELSLGRLERTLGQRQELSQWEEEKLALRATQVQQERVLQEKEAMEQRLLQQRQEEELRLREKQLEEVQQRQKQEQELPQRETQRQRVRQVPRLRISHW